MKRLKTDQPITEQAEQEFQYEASVMATLSNDKSENANYIVKFHGVCTGNYVTFFYYFESQTNTTIF